jgi:hypothetical protein
VNAGLNYVCIRSGKKVTWPKSNQPLPRDPTARDQEAGNVAAPGVIEAFSFLEPFLSHLIKFPVPSLVAKVNKPIGRLAHPRMHPVMWSPPMMEVRQIFSSLLLLR